MENSAAFQLMRFQILTAAHSESVGQKLSAAYIYAWDRGIFPSIHEGADWHKPFIDYFDVGQDMVDDLIKVLDENKFTFYELEDYYDNSEWDRAQLIGACRYLFLSEYFDFDWNRLLTPMEHPTEASSITRPFSLDDIYLN